MLLCFLYTPFNYCNPCSSYSALHALYLWIHSRICCPRRRIANLLTQFKEEEGLHWPLHVYGLIATRDSLDHRRNLLFQRARDNCQTITQEVCTFSFFLDSVICFCVMYAFSCSSCKKQSIQLRCYMLYVYALVNN
jgi:hypothetical protein